MTTEQPSRNQSLDERLAGLMETADPLCADDEQRREPLMERAESLGLPRELAERAYDLAIQEEVPPAYGIAVAAAGVSVQPLDSPAPDVQAVEETEPEWVDQPPGAKAAETERRMRQTFRRVRSFLADAPTPRDAFSALSREPDLEAFDY